VWTSAGWFDEEAVIQGERERGVGHADDRVNVYAMAAGVPTLVGVVSGVAATVVTPTCSPTALALTRVVAGVESALFAPTTAVTR